MPFFNISHYVILNDSPVLCEKLQLSLFKLGYKWDDGGREVQHIHTIAIYLTKHGRLFQTTQRPPPKSPQYTQVSPEYILSAQAGEGEDGGEVPIMGEGKWRILEQPRVPKPKEPHQKPYVDDDII